MSIKPQLYRKGAPIFGTPSKVIKYTSLLNPESIPEGYHILFSKTNRFLPLFHPSFPYKGILSSCIFLLLIPYDQLISDEDVDVGNTCLDLIRCIFLINVKHVWIFSIILQRSWMN